jgi:hypothetical protein
MGARLHCAAPPVVIVGLNVPLAGPCSLLLATRQARAGLFTSGRCEWGISRRLIAELRERCTLR